MTRTSAPLALVILAGLGMSAAISTHAATTPAKGIPAIRSADTLRFVVAPTGNEARYRVREQLMGNDLPNDAVGKTDGITGAIVIGSDGKIVPAESKIVIDVSKLKSDRDRRDGYVQHRIMQTDQFPTVEIAPTELRGLSLPLPTSGTKTFDLLGNLTVHGVTKPTTWHVSANFAGDKISGTATTGFSFADFSLPQPKVPILLSVADTIKLEYDFTLVPKN
jgi:polyisoprenoid-binding protein YceI